MEGAVAIRLGRRQLDARCLRTGIEGDRMNISIREITAAVSIAVIIFALCSMFRSNWIFKQRMKVLHNPAVSPEQQLADFDALISYNAMLLRWWCWDIKKLKK